MTLLQPKRMWLRWLLGTLLVTLPEPILHGEETSSSDNRFESEAGASDLLEAAKESLQAGRSLEARDLARKALKIGTYGLEPILIKALAEFQVGNYEQAIDDSSQYLVLGGNSIKAYQVRGSAFVVLGKRIEAIDDFSAAIRHQPDNPIFWASRGSLRVALRHAEQGLEDLDMAAKLGRHTPGVYFDRGVALRQLGRNEESYESYTQALLLKPGYRDALLERGGVLECMGKDRESVMDYSEILRNDPKDQEARLYRAWTYAELGELSTSADDLQWIINYGQPEIAAYLELSNVLLRMGKVAEAVKANENAIKLVKKDDARYRILSEYQSGLLLLVKGNLDGAKRRYGTANDMAEKALDMIAVEEAIRRLKSAEHLLGRKRKILRQELLSALEKLQERIQSQAKQDTRYCALGYF